jgi:hypothetical protein
MYFNIINNIYINKFKNLINNKLILKEMNYNKKLK